MRSRTTRARRNTPARRRTPTRHSRPTPTRRRATATARRQPARRRDRAPRRPYRRGGRGSAPHLGRSLHSAILAGLAVTAVAIAAVFLLGAVKRAPVAASTPLPVAAQIVYTARTANDAAIALPGAVQNDLTKAADAHQAVKLTTVGYTGDVSSSVIDMTPRTGNSSQDPILKVPGRIAAAIAAKVATIQADVDSPAAAPGGRALYIGLTRTDFTAAPVVIVSSGLDLSNPDNFRSLDWSVPPANVVATVKNADDLAALHGPVTFVLVPTAGPQPQLAQAQVNYLEAVWTALLKASGATSVTFIDAAGAAPGTAPGAAAPGAPIVALPSAPATPEIQPVAAGPNKKKCTVPDSFFIFNTPTLVSPATTVRALTPCIDAALAAHATFQLDGWASYEGPLNAEGQPPTNEPWNQQISQKRVTTIANLLVNELNVPRSDITRMTAHGNLDQPNPNPRSAANRVVVITYTASH
jgi:hypothetical protein